MRYDAECGKIRIDFKEFTAIARRGISPTLPYDEDEPRTDSLSLRFLRAYLGEVSAERMYFGFSALGYDFELSAVCEATDSEGITIAREISSSPDKPKKEELAEVRGEAFVAAHIFGSLAGLSSVKIRIILFNRESGESGESVEVVGEKKLSAFFAKCVGAVALFARPEVERVTDRLPSMRALKFPYPNVREGQSRFVRSAYRILSRGGSLYASAPTGTGKTVSALYPAIRALGDERFAKIFYFTPKTTTAEAARDCIAIMTTHGLRIRAINLSSKERCCISGHLCREAKRLCPNSSTNHLTEAVTALYALDLPVVTAKEVREIAAKFSVCPYELSLFYSELCDLIICDFNYLFDPAVYIRRYFDGAGAYAFLIDEAHNLSERVREAYSAEISTAMIRDFYEHPVLSPLSDSRILAESASATLTELLTPYLKEEIRENAEGERVGATHISEPPAELYSLISELHNTLTTELTRSYGAKDEEATARTQILRSFAHEIGSFYSVLCAFDSGYEAFIFYENGELRIKLYCLDTGRIIRRRLALGHGALLFSATLSPLPYYREILGGDRSDEVLEVNSPFDPSQLSVSIMDKISTRWSEREDTLLAVIKVIAATISARRGNYMIFSPSFAYSEALAKAFRAKYPKLRVISQTKNMSAKEKEELLDAFREDNESYLVAFCVMGGIYSEGIDLAGDSLIGAIIVGIGMPALSYEREAIAAYYDEKYEEGKQYAYIYPGMNRVFQAAGRVIRREDDKGVIVLIDDRFDDPIYKKSLPKLWEGVKFIASPKELKEELEEFWKDGAK